MVKYEIIFYCPRGKHYEESGTLTANGAINLRIVAGKELKLRTCPVCQSSSLQWRLKRPQ